MGYTTDQINELLHDPDVSNEKLCEALYNVHEDYLVIKEDVNNLINETKSKSKSKSHYINQSWFINKLKNIQEKDQMHERHPTIEQAIKTIRKRP